MARIEGVDLPRNKRVEVGLTYIYGIGRRVRTNPERDGVNPDTRIKDLTDAEVAQLRDLLPATSKLKAICAARCR
jgi:small subunit ribosomal protein S13